MPASLCDDRSFRAGLEQDTWNVNIISRVCTEQPFEKVECSTGVASSKRQCVLEQLVLTAMESYGEL